MKEYPFIDVIAMGEGEETFLELCQAYDEAWRSGLAPRLK
jgi:anaerobic magnesium-protoporphyrin IX monomethyl ester cyclase